MSQSPALESRHAVRVPGLAKRELPGWVHAIEIWLVRRQDRQDLSALDDRLLEDLGISREDALWNAGKPFWRP